MVRLLSFAETIIAMDLSEATKLAYKSNKFDFNLNKGHIDIERKFRFFCFKGVDYIAKQVNLNKGYRERLNAKKFKVRVDGARIANYVIRVVTPILVEDGESLYYVTPFKGISLESCYYSNAKFPHDDCFSISVLYGLLKIFIANGVYYYDFLPRNVIISDDVIFLIDFENVIFQDRVFFDIRWHTNFQLNWSYIFEKSLLEKESGKLLIMNPAVNNYPLSKFEQTFKNIVEVSGDETTVRKLILKTVLVSEKSYTHKNDGELVPMDLCHFISDALGTRADVFSDILFYLIRLRSEAAFGYFAKRINECILFRKRETMVDNLKEIFVAMKRLVYNEYYQNNYVTNFDEDMDTSIVNIFKKEMMGTKNEY